VSNKIIVLLNYPNKLIGLFFENSAYSNNYWVELKSIVLESDDNIYFDKILFIK
jgi:hypothetical protein